MNPNIRSLLEVASKPSRKIVGLMSGTSLDGLDVAICSFSGHGRNTAVKITHFVTVPYTLEQKNALRTVFCNPSAPLKDICSLHAWVGSLHARIMLDCLREWEVEPGSIDVIASHGQTIYHAPKQSLHLLGDKTFNSTLQIGDGDHIAVATGILTISDFRQKHVAAGGEGAPLALYGDYLLFSKQGENRIMLNIGGIANFTYLPGNGDVRKILATDTGPGNTLMDHVCRAHFSTEFDFQGRIAAQGQVHPKLLEELQSHPFFQSSLPRTTGQELFNPQFLLTAQERCKCVELNPTDLLATLCRFTAETIASTIRRVIVSDRDEIGAGDGGWEPILVFGSGGGSLNVTLMSFLKSLLPQCTFANFEETFSVSADAKEALLFATLANETVCGDGTLPWRSMGKLSFPK